MVKIIFFLCALCGNFVFGAEFGVIDKFSVGGDTFVVQNGSVGIGTRSVSGVRLAVIGSTDAAYSLAVGTSANYSFSVSTSGMATASKINAGEMYQGGQKVLDASMLDDFTLKLDTTTNKIRLADRVEQNIMLDAFKIAVSSSLSKFNMVDGMMDEFEDQTGVDLSSSTGASYDSGGHYFTNQDSYTNLLLHANSAAFNDASYSSHTATTVGNTKIATAQYKFGGSSARVYGSGDHLFVPAHSDWNFGTGDFTIDFWVYVVSAVAYGGIVATYGGSGTTWIARLNSDGTQWSFYDSNVGDHVGGTAPLNTWTHYAVVKTGTTARLFIGGNQVASWTDTNTYGQNLVNIGWSHDVYSFNGYIDELRISKGTSRWTTNFSPSSGEYSSDTATQLLFHFNGADGETSFKDSSLGNKTVTRNGAVFNDDTQKKFGYASYKFDGAGDYLSAPAGADWNFDGDFTIDCWVLMNARNSTIVKSFTNEDWNSAATGDWILLVDGNGYISFVVKNIGTTSTTSSVGVGLWTHIALTRTGNTTAIFNNGAGTFGGFIPGTLGNIQALTIGKAATNVTGDFNGWIDELRISKGVARWTTNFSTATLTNEYSATGISNMTLVSTTTTAEAVPNTARLILFEEDVDSATLNSDFKGYVSRDNSTWSQVTLLDNGGYQSGRRIVSGSADLSSEALSATVRWKVTTHNARLLKLHGVGLTWD